MFPKKMVLVLHSIMWNSAGIAQNKVSTALQGKCLTVYRGLANKVKLRYPLRVHPMHRIVFQLFIANM